MLFVDRIQELRESRNMLQRHVAAAFDIDDAIYCRIERGERRARREYVDSLAEVLKTDKEELLILWLSDQLTAVIADEKDLPDRALEIAKENIEK